MDEQPIRILHVIGSMNRGGAETMIMNLYRHVDRTKVQFDFVENTDREAAFDQEILALGGRIYRCPHYIGTNHAAYVRWWKLFLNKHAPDYSAVHGHLGSTAAIYLALAKRHGLYTIAHSHNTRGRGFRSGLYHLYSYPTRYIADWFFACSHQAGLDRFGKRVASDPTRFMVLNNAIETGNFAYQPELRWKKRAELGIGDDEILVGHVGRFVAQKNHLFLIDIFSEMLKKNSSVKLLLVGEEDLEGKVRKRVTALGLTDRVIFAGVQEDTVPYYESMDLFILPSLFEGLGMAAVEAQASGLRCIISDGVSEECIRTNGLVSVFPLKESAEAWAGHALERIPYIRRDCSAEVAASGYDVGQVANWIENFYLERARKA